MDPLSLGLSLGGAALGAFGSSKGSEQQTVNEPWGAIQDNLKRLHPAAENIWNNALPMYPGATFAPMNPLQIGGQFGSLDYAQNRFQPGVSTYQQNLANMMGSPNRITELPAVRAQMDTNRRGVTESLRNEWLPMARQGATMAGQYGGSKGSLAEGRAIGDAASGLADANAKTLGNAYNNALVSQRSAAGMMPNALQMGFQGPQTAMNIGQQGQDQFNRGIAESMERYYYPQSSSQDMLGWLNGIYQNSIGAGGTSTTQLPGANPLSGALGGAALGYGISQNWNQPQQTGGSATSWADQGMSTPNYGFNTSWPSL